MNFLNLKITDCIYKCKECGKRCTKLKNEVIKNFPIMHQFCNGDLNKYFLLIRKSVYPYEDMDSWKKIDETAIPPKEALYSELNEEGISDADHAHVQKLCEVFEIKNIVDYDDLYVQCDTLLLADVFENFRDKCIEMCELDPAYFLTEPGLAWQPYLKETGINLELLTYINMLLMVENGIRGGICQATHSYAKGNNKYVNNYDKNIE